MNIFIFTASDSSFNSLRPEIEMFTGFSKRGHQVTIATQLDSDAARIYLQHGIKVIDCQPQKKISPNAIMTVRKELQTRQYDILYATNSKSIPNGAIAALGLDVKVVSYRGTTGGLYRHDPSAYLTHLHPRIDGIVCVSEAVRDDVRKRVWKNKDKVIAIHKGHNLEWYNHSAADLTEFGITKKDFTLICAVNARPSKGIPVMLEAANLLSDIDNLHLLLVGKNMDRYSSVIAENKMRERIHVLGYRHDVPALITASDVQVQPSISGEGLPRAVMEAMGCGTPSVLTDTGGGKEVVEDGMTGFVVPTNNPEMIAEKIRILYEQPELLDTMAQKSKEKISNELSCERSTDLYLQYFEALLAG